MVSALPMQRHQETFGAVIVLSTSGHPLADAETRLACLLADTAAIVIRQQRALWQSARRAEQLQRALDARVLIEQAKGAVAPDLVSGSGSEPAQDRPALGQSRNSPSRISRIVSSRC